MPILCNSLFSFLANFFFLNTWANVRSTIMDDDMKLLFTNSSKNTNFFTMLLVDLCCFLSVVFALLFGRWGVGAGCNNIVV